MNEVLKLFCFFQGFLPNSPLGLRPCSAQFALVTSVAAVGLLPGGIASSLIPKTCGCKSAECRLCKDVKRYHMKQVAWYFDRLGENGVDIGADIIKYEDGDPCYKAAHHRPVRTHSSDGLHWRLHRKSTFPVGPTEIAQWSGTG